MAGGAAAVAARKRGLARVFAGAFADAVAAVYRQKFWRKTMRLSCHDRNGMLY